jgi:predicted unusual protein kinase regulating ubiquinone biosynthesis (AarF/ABC1/UbiB family)
MPDPGGADGAEANRLGGRIRRYARVGTAVGGLAARLAGQRYLGLGLDRDLHAAELRAALGGLKGPLMKVAQILATIPDALPKEYAAELAQLQANAPAMGWPFVKRRMASELGPGWQQRFAGFEREAAAAASLGQVHRAVAHDGTRLACKLQYPDMQSAVEADLRQLRLILGIYERYDRAISTREIHAEIAARLREELDYGLEARHMALYGAMLAKEQAVHVPAPMPDLSTRRLLTMTWLDGVPLLRFIAEHEDVAVRNRVALAMFRAWYVPFYFYGTIHGDPHLGNYTVRPDATVNLLDFGCIRVFRAPFVQGVIDLYHALQRDDRDLAVHAYESWGFKGLNNEVIDVLNRWAGFVYGPLLEDRPRRIQEIDSGVYGRDVAEGVHADLRRLGPVTPPREFVFMDRAAIGLGAVFLHLRAEINWYRLFHELIAGFDVKALHRRQTRALKTAGVPLPP